MYNNQEQWECLILFWWEICESDTKPRKDIDLHLLISSFLLVCIIGINFLILCVKFRLGSFFCVLYIYYVNERVKRLKSQFLTLAYSITWRLLTWLSRPTWLTVSLDLTDRHRPKGGYRLTDGQTCCGPLATILNKRLEKNTISSARPQQTQFVHKLRKLYRYFKNMRHNINWLR